MSSAAEATRQRGRGAALGTGGNASPGRDRMWRVMRSMRAFQVCDLIEITSTPRKAAEKFLRALVRAEYVRVERRRGCAGSVYVLVRNTGPFAPRVGQAGLALDPNLEIEQLRVLRRELIEERVRCEQRLRFLGAYVEQFSPGAERQGAAR